MSDNSKRGRAHGVFGVTDPPEARPNQPPETDVVVNTNALLSIEMRNTVETLMQAIELYGKALDDGERVTRYNVIQSAIESLMHDFAVARGCARDGGGICPCCGGYAKRVADHEGSPNSLWECTKCHENYYTCTDSEASSYRALKKFTREFLGFTPGAFPKQFKQWAEQHTGKKQ